jgi:hypothetical protein
MNAAWPSTQARNLFEPDAAPPPTVALPAAAAARSFFPAAFVSFVFLLNLCCSANAQTPATPVAAPPPRAEHVFIVSFDGGKPAVMKESRMPTLFGLLPRAASTFSAQTIFPSITLPSHTSMLTGVGPEKHRVLWNNWEPEKGMVTVPTIFALAKKQSLSTAMFVGKPKFLHLYVPKTVDEFSLPEYYAAHVSEAAARYIVAKKPALCFIHFADPDGAGHAQGWGSSTKSAPSPRPTRPEDDPGRNQPGGHRKHKRCFDNGRPRRPRQNTWFGHSGRHDHPVDRVGRERPPRLRHRGPGHDLRHGRDRPVAPERAASRKLRRQAGDKRVRALKNGGKDLAGGFRQREIRDVTSRVGLINVAGGKLQGG